MLARLWYGLSVALCVFDLDHTLIQTPLDLAAMAVDMRALIEGSSGPLPRRDERYRVGELIAYCRAQAPALEAPVWDVALDHERRAMEVAALEPGALAAVGGARRAGFATAIWTNNARGSLRTISGSPRLPLPLASGSALTTRSSSAIRGSTGSPRPRRVSRSSPIAPGRRISIAGE